MQLQRRRKKSTKGWMRDRSTITGPSTPPVTVTIAIGSMALALSDPISLQRWKENLHLRQLRF